MAGILQTASGVVNMATRHGIGELQRVLGCSRRQAEQILVLAARAQATGGVLDPSDLPIGTVKAAQASAAAVPPAEPAPFDAEAEAQTRAAKIRAMPPSDQAPIRGEPAGEIRDWVRGAAALDGTDQRSFFSEVPEHEWQQVTERTRVHRGGQLDTVRGRRLAELLAVRPDLAALLEADRRTAEEMLARLRHQEEGRRDG